MKKMPHEVAKGDTITIAAQGIKVTGKVYSVDWWESGGYYIELTEANVPGGYSYWKQVYDGGQLVEINGKKVEY